MDKDKLKEEIEKYLKYYYDVKREFDLYIHIKKNADIKIILDEVEALQIALSESLEGDIVIVFFERLNPLVDFIKSNQEDDANLGNVVNSN